MIVVDRRAEMALSSPGLPWLRKDEAMHVASTSSRAASPRRAASSAISTSPGPGDPFWRPPRSEAQAELLDGAKPAASGLRADGQSRRAARVPRGPRQSVPGGTFVFVLSDFLVSPSRGRLGAGRRAPLGRRPGGRQDPIWEQSFPPSTGS